eukprot:69109_1
MSKCLEKPDTAIPSLLTLAAVHLSILLRFVSRISLGCNTKLFTILSIIIVSVSTYTQKYDNWHQSSDTLPSSLHVIATAMIQLSYSFFILLALLVPRFVPRISSGRNTNLFTMLLSIIIGSAHAQWQESSGTLQSPFRLGAIGYSSLTGTIWLLGGRGPTDPYSTLIRQIDVATETTTPSSTYFPSPVDQLYGYAQFWTSVDHYVYMIDPYEARTFIRFDVDTGTQDIHYNGINISYYAPRCWDGPYEDFSFYSCLTSINVDAVDYLVVIGGALSGGDNDPCG